MRLRFYKNDDLAKKRSKFDGILCEVLSLLPSQNCWLHTHSHELFVEWSNKSFTRYLKSIFRTFVDCSLEFIWFWIETNATIENRLKFHSLRISQLQSHIVFQFPQRWFVLYLTVFFCFFSPRFMYNAFTLFSFATNKIGWRKSERWNERLRVKERRGAAQCCARPMCLLYLYFGLLCCSCCYFVDGR